MPWKRLTTIDPETSLFRGATFRFKRERSPAEIVDLMLFICFEESGFGLLRVTGYDAGDILVVLPKEAAVRHEHVHAISAGWLAENWNKWVAQEISPQDVWYRQRRPSPRRLPGEVKNRAL